MTLLPCIFLKLDQIIWALTHMLWLCSHGSHEQSTQLIIYSMHFPNEMTLRVSKSNWMELQTWNWRNLGKQITASTTAASQLTWLLNIHYLIFELKPFLYAWKWLLKDIIVAETSRSDPPWPYPLVCEGSFLPFFSYYFFFQQ